MKAVLVFLRFTIQPRHDLPATRLRRGWIAVILTCLATISAPAQPPSNDQCTDAMVIPGAGPFPHFTPTIDITDAGTLGDPPPPSCNFLELPISRSAWYVFSPAVSGLYSISTCSDAPTATTIEDTILAIYTSTGGCAGPFVEIANGCNDDACGPVGLQSSLISRLLSDTTYYIVVWQLDDAVPAPSNSSLQLNVNFFSVPSNDTCDTAIEVELNLPVTGTTVGATNDYQLNNASCFHGLGQIEAVTADGRDVVFGFTAPVDGNYSIKVLNYSTQGDLVVYVGADCPSGSRPARLDSCLGASNRNPVSSSESVVCLPLLEGQRVLIFVDEEGETDGSTFNLEITECKNELEPNGEFLASNPAVCGGTGSIQVADDIDFFALGAPPAGARVFALIDGEAANRTDFDMRLVTTMETLEFDNDNNDFSYGDSSPNIAGTILTGEPAFLRINYNGPLVAEPYRLYAIVQPPIESASTEEEPNNSLPQANLTPNNYVRGTLAGNSPSTDLDVYALSAEAGEIIFLSLDADPLRDNTPINAKLDLMDGFGNVLASVNDNNDRSSVITHPGSQTANSPYSPGESLVYRVVTEGTYFARVGIGTSSIGLTGNGDYLLSISKNCVAGSLGINARPVIDGLKVITPIASGGTTQVSADIYDADLGQTHVVTLQWGDGSPDTVLQLILGETQFAVDHVYPNNPPGISSTNYTLRVLVRDNLGRSATQTSTIAVQSIDAPRFLEIHYLPNGNVLLNLQGSAGITYRILSADNFQSWTQAGQATMSAQGEAAWEDTRLPANTSRFYRAVAP